MAIKVGDTVFDALGRPGVVIGRDEKSQLVAERAGETYEKQRRRGFINGLSEQERLKFNEVVDQIFEIKDPAEKVTRLNEKIDELREDPRNHVVTRYLEAELTHTMNSQGIHPRQYTVSEYHLRS